MAEVKWIKITVNMFDDEKIKLIEAMPEGDAILVIFLKLMTLAGKTNANGYIYFKEQISYSEEMLATIFNKNIQTLRLALVTLRKFQMIEIEENGYILLSNFEKHQNTDGLAKIKKQNNDRQKRFRERTNSLLKQHTGKENNVIGDVTNNVTVTESNAIDIDIEEEIDIERTKEQADKKIFTEKVSSELSEAIEIVPEEVITPVIPKKDFIEQLMEIFGEEYYLAKQVQYLDAEIDKKHMGMILGKFKKLMPNANSEEMLAAARMVFRKSCEIADDNFLSEISIPKFNSQINQYINRIKNGKFTGKNTGFNPSELEGFLAEQSRKLNTATG